MIDGKVAPPEPKVGPPQTQEMKVEMDKDAKIRELEKELRQLNLGPGSQTPSSASQATLQATPQATPTQDTSTPALGGFNLPLPPTPSTEQAQAWGQSQTQSSLQDLERMVRDHVANNQQHLNAQAPANGSYVGPTMPQIRQVPDVQSQADLIMGSIKAACPVFGQTVPAGSMTTISGINTLSQGLQQQAGLQQPVGSQQLAGQLLGQVSHPHGLQQQVGQTLGPQQQVGQSLGLQQQVGQLLGQQQVGQLLGQQHAGHPAVQQLHAGDTLGQQQLLGHRGLGQWTGLPQAQPPLQNSSQIPPNLLSTLAQLGPSALPVLQALQQQIPLTNNL